MASELIVGSALLGVLQGVIGLGHVLEFLLRVGVRRDVRMVLARELAIRFLDVVSTGLALDAERSVVVLVLHRAAACCITRACRRDVPLRSAPSRQRPRNAGTRADPCTGSE